MDLKRCPFCAEDVKAEAIVCRYCGRDLNVKRLSRQEQRWIYVNNLVGSTVGFIVMCTVLFAAMAEFTGIGGGFAPLEEPFSPIRNEIAKGWAALGAVFGLAVGIFHGTLTARQKLARVRGEEAHYF